MSHQICCLTIPFVLIALTSPTIAPGQHIRWSGDPESIEVNDRTCQKVMISAGGPERDVVVGTPTPVPPYSGFLGSETGHVSVDWVAPEAFVLGQDADIELVLRNRGPLPVREVVIQPTLPESFRLISSIPKSELIGEHLSWRLTKLDLQEEARIQIRIQPKWAGDVRSNARVTYSTASTTALRVVEPMLKINVTSPEKAIIGSQVVFNVMVSNPGTGKATNAILDAHLPDGLTRKSENATYALGTLNPGESRSVRVVATMSERGNHPSQFTATADNDLHDEAFTNVLGLSAELDLKLDGPTFRYVTRPATYTLTVMNTGTAAAESVSLQVAVPKPFAFLEADELGTFDAATKSVNWLLGGLEVGRKTEVTFKLRALASGEFPILANADAERGLTAEAHHMTKVEGIAAILLEVVDVDDPVEVGSPTMYEVLVTNQGTEFARNVSIHAVVPQGIEIIDGQAPSEATIEGRTIHFASLPRLAPRADAIYRITIRGVTSGDFRVEVQAMADSLESPVTELESTKVYRD